MKSIHTRGFTLIELLVVIAIISLLSSVVLATLSTAREKAKVAQTVSNIHQMEIAFQMLYDVYGCWPGESGTGTCVNTAKLGPTIASLVTDNDFNIKNYLSQAPAWPFNPAVTWGYDNDSDNASTTCTAYSSAGVNLFPMASIPYDIYAQIEEAIDGTLPQDVDTPASRFCGKVRFNNPSPNPGTMLVTLSYTQ